MQSEELTDADRAKLHSADAKTAWAECEALREKVAALEAALSAAEPVAWQPRYKQEVIDHHKSIGSDLCEYAMTVYPTKEQAQGYGYGGYECRALYAEPQPAPSVAVKDLEWSPRNDQPQYEVCADTPFGRYKTSNKGEYGFGWMQPRQTVWSGFLPTLEEAKAAAQADYEARIRSALSAQVQDVAVAEIVSAHGDPEAFGERELVALIDIQKFPYRTKLYAAAPAVKQGEVE
ncbi:MULTISPECIES: hypothetical protein [Rhizobium/Agrobacterium group]|uniref:hypothetical protein n=1 Tax=Rhizobium TaxID=379 RepID=UPI0028A80074